MPGTVHSSHIATTYNKSKSPVFLKPSTLPLTDLTTASNPAHFDTDALPHLPTTPTVSMISRPRSYIWKPQTNKQYVCSECGKCLSHIFTLNRHRRTVCGKPRNTNGKWKCDICTKTYESQGSLSRHHRYECGVPPQFHCVFCNRVFTQRCSLSRHLKNFHKESSDGTIAHRELDNNAGDTALGHQAMRTPDSELKSPGADSAYSSLTSPSIWTNIGAAPERNDNSYGKWSRV